MSSTASMNTYPTAEEIAKGFDFTNQVAIVTGANTGIGKETAKVLTLKNCHVIMACRSVQKGMEAREEILKAIGQGKASKLEVLQLDLRSLQSVREFANEYGKRFKRLDLLINNAGIMTAERSKTADGFESHVGINHLGHFLLTLLLLPISKQTSSTNHVTRIVVVSSDAHKNSTKPDLNDFNMEKEDFNMDRFYGRSKLLNNLFVQYLDHLLKEQNTHVICNALHPGIVLTDLGREFGKELSTSIFEETAKSFKLPLLTVAQGAANTLYLCGSTAPEVLKGGNYFVDMKPGATKKIVSDRELQKQVWQLSLKLVGLQHHSLL